MVDLSWALTACKLSAMARTSRRSLSIKNEMFFEGEMKPDMYGPFWLCTTLVRSSLSFFFCLPPSPACPLPFSQALLHTRCLPPFPLPPPPSLSDTVAALLVCAMVCVQGSREILG